MKRLYHILSLLALVNLFAVCGFVSYLFSSGRLNRERVDQIGMVLRGEFPASQPASQPATVTTAPAEPSRAELARLAAQKEYYQLVAERHRREMDDRRALNQAIQLDVVRRMEEIARRKAELDEQQKRAVKQGEQEGFARTLEMYAGMEPAKAKDLLRNHNKEADAVQLLMQMDPARAKKIVNACKTQDELLWIGRILNQISQMNQESGAGVDGPKPSAGG